MIYPGTPVSFTEWIRLRRSESDFSTALGDADAYGILGRERVYLGSRWTAPSPTNPNYLALKLFTNYDGQHHGFATTSISDTNNGDPDLFSSYAALNSTGTSLTLLVLNKDPANSVQAHHDQWIHAAERHFLHFGFDKSHTDRIVHDWRVVVYRDLWCRTPQHCSW